MNRKLSKYVGHINQIFPVTEFKLTGGKQEGVRGIMVENAVGLQVTFLPDRGLDIYSLKYKSVGTNYLTAAGIIAPSYAHRHQNGWIESFAGGFLTTCGLQNIGNGCRIDAKDIDMHGNISNTPAEFLQVRYEEIDGELFVKISGDMREASLFGNNLILRRTYTIGFNSHDILMEDTIENLGFSPSPFMFLYHFNIGYPLLSEDATLHLDSLDVKPRTEHAANHLDSYAEITAPVHQFKEMCYYHNLASDENGFSNASIYNESLGFGININFPKFIFDHFIQWKMLNEGEYVIGLEPCNATIESIVEAEKDGTLKTIQPGEKIYIKNTISIIKTV